MSDTPQSTPDIGLVLGIDVGSSKINISNAIQELQNSIQDDIKIKLKADSSDIKNAIKQEVKNLKNQNINVNTKINATGTGLSNFTKQINKDIKTMRPTLSKELKQIENMLNGSFKGISPSNKSLLGKNDDIIKRYKDQVKEIKGKIKEIVGADAVGDQPRIVGEYENLFKQLKDKNGKYDFSKLNNLSDSDKQQFDQFVSKKLNVLLDEEAKLTQIRNEAVEKVAKIRSENANTRLGDNAIRQVQETYRKYEQNINKNPELKQQYDDFLHKSSLIGKEGGYKSLNDASAAAATLRKETERLGATTETTSQKIRKLFDSHLGTAAVLAGINAMQMALRDVFQQILAIDTAMTELKKVTDLPESDYDEYLSRAKDEAKELGAGVADVVNATADFARLGYNLNQAEELSKAATVYKNVGDGITDISTASESIISTMKAFNIEASDAMGIVDRFNEVGKRRLPTIKVAISVKSQRWSRPRKDLVFVKYYKDKCNEKKRFNQPKIWTFNRKENALWL